MSDTPSSLTLPTPAERTHAAAADLSFWDRISFSSVRVMLRALVAVAGIHGLYRTCQAFGTLEYLINYKRRRRVKRLLKTVYGRELGGKDRRRAVRAHFMRQRCDKAFYLVCDLLPPEAVRQRFSIVNRRLMDEGLARGKGVYVMLCHHGAHHVTGLTMALMGYRVGGIRDPHEGPLRKYIHALWAEKHPELYKTRILYSGDFTRQIYRLFKDNYALGSALDVTRVRDDRLRTVPVRIFGGERPFLTGTLQIALRCGAVVLQGFIVSDDDFHYRLELHGPMADPETSSETPELLAEVMQKYADNIAEYARQYPDHITRV